MIVGSNTAKAGTQFFREKVPPEDVNELRRQPVEKAGNPGPMFLRLDVLGDDDDVAAHGDLLAVVDQ